MFTSALLSGCSFLRSVPFLFSHPLYRERIIFLCGQQPLLSGYSLLRPDLYLLSRF